MTPSSDHFWHLTLWCTACLLTFPVISGSDAQSDAQDYGNAIKIVINELFVAPRSGIPEFIELLNVGPNTVDLATLSVEDARRAPGTLTSSTEALLNPGEFVVLTIDLQALRQEFGAFSGWEVRPWPSLNNAGDNILISIDGMAQDSVSYESSWIEAGKSIERINPSAPASYSGNWAISSSNLGATPGLRNSQYVPDTIPPRVLSAEYISPTTIEIAFSEPISRESIARNLILLDNVAVTGMDFSAPFIDLRIVALTRHRYLTVSGLVDFSGNEAPTQSLEIAQRAEPHDLVITEIMANPSASASGTDLPEFVEVKNWANHPVSLTGLKLAIGPAADPDKEVSLRKRGVVLGVGEHAVVYSEPVQAWISDPATMSSLAQYDPTAFGQKSFFRIPVSGGSLGLNKGSDALRIEDSLLGVIEEIVYLDDWHDDRFLSTKGRSLERIRVTENDPLHLSWTTSVTDSGVSLGYSYAALSSENGLTGIGGDLRFNEIMYQPVANDFDGRPNQPEYIEFINTSASALDLNGLYLIKTQNERMSQDSLRLAYRETRLEPGGLVLAFTVPRYIPDGDEFALQFLSDAFPQIDISASTILLPLRSSLSLSNAGASLTLFSAGNVQLDAVTYSPEWHHFLVADGAGLSLERVDPDGPSNSESNWSTSVRASGGSPGSQNSVTISRSLSANTTPVSIEPKTFSPNSDGVHDLTRISLQVEHRLGAVRVRIFDLDGREVRRLIDTELFVGEGQYYWDGSSDDGLPLASGIYIVLVEIADAMSRKTKSYKAPVAILH